MKLYLLHEATIQDIQNKIPILINKYYKDNQEKGLGIIQSLVELDPTHGKYIEWIIRNHKKGTIITPEDNDKIHNLLTKFVKVKGRLNDKDINNYSPGDLSKAMDELNPNSSSRRQLKLRGRSGELVIPDGAEHILNSGEYDVIRIDSPEASSILCSGTEWCTANKETAEEYLDDGPLYLVYIDGKREYLIHYETNQFMDIYDRPIAEDEDEDDYELKFKLVDLLEPVTGKNAKNNQHLAYEYARNIIKGRFPEGEEIISKNFRYAYEYARDIIKGRWPEGEEIISQNAFSSYYYAKDIIKGRWLEGEEAISKKSEYSRLYAEDVIKGRWPEGEEAISKKSFSSYMYAKDVIKGRWPEGEKAISRDVSFAYYYAENVIKSRFFKGEETISKNASFVYTYARDIIKGRFFKGEEAISKNASFAYGYARDVIKGRFPEGEEAISKNPEFAYEYARDIIKGRWPEGEKAINKDSECISKYKDFLNK